VTRALPSVDMTEPRKRAPGGGRKLEQEGPTTAFPVKLSEPRRMRWEALAALRGVKVAAIVRDAVDAACEAAGILPTIPARAVPEDTSEYTVTEAEAA
jgi:hypothetical protein